MKKINIKLQNACVEIKVDERECKDFKITYLDGSGTSNSTTKGRLSGEKKDSKVEKYGREHGGKT